ncbi:MAG: prephenate dehydrogenase [Candidatus Binatia bacterium]
MPFMFRRMVVAGVGLIGGSLALAARKYSLVEEIVGYGRGEKNLRLAQRRGIVESYFMDEGEIPGGVDLLILATPVQSIVRLTESFLPKLESGCLISDVGSVKGKIVREVERILPSQIQFVGAHPIAGGEEWGAQAATPDLFSGHRCILTPSQRTDPKALKKISSLWRHLGARVEMMDPRLHDRVLAVVSHLPHVLAFALVDTLGRTQVDSVDLKDYCGGGFKDLTRIASSRPEIWRDICLVNRQAIAKSICDYIKGLERLRRWISDGEGDLLEREFDRASELRRAIP